MVLNPLSVLKLHALALTSLQEMVYSPTCLEAAQRRNGQLSEHCLGIRGPSCCIATATAQGQQAVCLAVLQASVSGLIMLVVC